MYVSFFPTSFALAKEATKPSAQQEKKILNGFNAKKSRYVVNYSYLEEDTGTEYVYLILDLCEESLESFVKFSTLPDLEKALPEILTQILKGLADLHSGPNPILHRDLKPSNVLRDSQGKFLIADFGISRLLKNGLRTYESRANRGTEYWIAPESYCEDEDTVDKGRYKKEMLAYYVATKGKHRFGTKRHILDNMLNGNPVGLDQIKDEALKDLLFWMLNLRPEDRPSANESLKHPFLMSDDEKFDFLCKVGTWKPTANKDERDRVKCQHWYDRPRPRPQTFYKIGDHKAFFIKKFPNLPVWVHAAVRSNEEFKNNTELKYFFNESEPRE
ncbi:serine/threonine-protein kinase/endoribonuclease IRE2-like [Xenia sp. Carnegie-2017]|uniref:serine/threonine-protein kinase/endoribonuclease IRE2-like n=1 Tax=Xenia sp. Carnegie-2017 TaxID=2897299 RepID=UPI001F048FB5|nr:serine/threonine-protein kinase/endoribonuclease IRE2-like [Xenia sp. Carnegie-2017]